VALATTDFYREPDPKICQGDIIAHVPHLYMQHPVTVLRATTAKKLGSVYQPFDLGGSPPGGLKFSRGEPEEVAASCLMARGILLTHGCEVDKDSKHRMVALVRALPPVEAANPRDAQIIREQKNLSTFYLPDYPERLEESYVDFRRVSCISPMLIDPSQRIASLTENGLKQFLIKFFMYITRSAPESIDTLIGARDI
jgi:hypothetical protein